MLKHLKKEDRYVEITGFRDVKIEDVNGFMKTMNTVDLANTATQLFNAERVATWEHVYFAVVDALLSFAEGWNISKNLSMEILLYASGQRQISKALDLIGVKRGLSNVALVIVGQDRDSVSCLLSAITERLGEHPDETVLEMSKAKVDCIQQAFGISETEMEAVSRNDPDAALVNLVIEKMALLSTFR